MTEGKLNCSNTIVAENIVSEAREFHKGLFSSVYIHAIQWKTTAVKNKINTSRYAYISVQRLDHTARQNIPCSPTWCQMKQKLQISTILL